MVFQLVGYSTFKSKKGNDCTALYLVDMKPLNNGRGNAVVTKITTVNCGSLELGKVNVSFDDRGFVESVSAIK